MNPEINKKLDELEDVFLNILSGEKNSSGKLTITQAMKIDGDQKGTVNMVAGIFQITQHVSMGLRLLKEIKKEIIANKPDSFDETLNDLVCLAYDKRITRENLKNIVANELEKESIRQNPTMSKAAKAIGMNPSSLSRRKKYV